MYRFLLSFVIALPLLAHGAGIDFVEVMYDPEGNDSGREWVRIQNNTGAELNLTNWRFVEGGTNHKLKALESPLVPAGGTAVIAADATTYLAEHLNSPDVIFDATFSLSNTGEALALKDASSTIVATHTYTPAPKAPKPVATKVTKSTKTKVQKEAPQFASSTDPDLAAVGASGSSSGLWFVALGVLIFSGIGALFWIPKKQGTGYTIE